MRNIKTLELDKILLLCSEHAVGSYAKELVLKITPAITYAKAKLLLDQTSAASSLSIRFGNPAFYTVVSPDEIISKASRGAHLSPAQLLEIALILNASNSLVRWYKSARGIDNILDPLFESLNPDNSLKNDISDVILGENEIADNATPELSNIRRKIRNSEQRVRETLDKIVRSSTQKYLQEQIVTMRNGRYVVPVKSEFKNEIKGMVHDTSASGSTFFIEPMAVVELNNQVKELEIEQRKEIDRILRILSEKVADQGDFIRSDYKTVIELDVIFARCKLGDRMKASVPNFVDAQRINLSKAKHPLIDQNKVVSIDIEIGENFDTLVITGPNTGGKTVALKTIGLLTMMTACGLMIPASSSSEVGFYTNILCDIGDEQSIEQSLSTFSGHMTNIVNIIEKAGNDSLVLIDELGAGTDPVEGAALAVAIISKIRSKGAHVIATTHYAEIKVFALQTQGVENASCEFNVTTLKPTYRLLIGTPGRSNAFAISSRLGLSSEIISEAEKLVSSENRRFEDVVDSLERTRLSLEEERKQAVQLRQQAATAKKTADHETKQLQQEQDDLIEQARDRSRSILERVRFQADNVLDELEKLKKEKDKADFSSSFTAAQRKIKGLVDDMEDLANPVISSTTSYTPPRAIKQGDIVFLVDFNTQGTVIKPPDKKGNLTVRAGILDTKVSLNRIKLLDKPSDKVKLNGGKVRSQRSLSSASTSESVGKVDLRGLDSEEARLELKRYIDYALLNHLNLINIVHGKGTGVLRDMVTYELKGNNHIQSYRLGRYGEGGDGVTIAEL